MVKSTEDTTNRGYNQMADALKKAGITNTSTNTRDNKPYMGGGENFKIPTVIVGIDKKFETPPIYEEKHYSNPILQDAYSYIKLIQSRIDNIEALEKEISNYSPKGFKFFDKEQNKTLENITLDYMIRERNKMLDSLSSLMYNEKYTPDLNNIKPDIEKTPKVKLDMMSIKTEDISSTSDKKRYKIDKRLSKNEVNLLTSMYPEYTMKQLSETFEIPVPLVRQYLVDNNVPIRPRGGDMKRKNRKL